LLDDAVFAECVSVVSPTGVAAVVNTPITSLTMPPLGACLMLEDIQDPGNLGTLLRSAAASGLTEVLLSPGCADAWAPRTLRAGQGAQFLLSLHEGVNLLEVAAGYTGHILAAAAQGQRAYSDANLTGAVAFLIGNEGAGLSAAMQSVAHEHVSIPMAAGVESLNAAVAGSILMFERQRQSRSSQN
jgi:TrmH family RNA methyltransferase